MEKRVVEHSMSTDRVKERLTVDQDATVAMGDVAMRFLEVGGRTSGITIQVPSRDVVLVGFVPGAGCFKSWARR